MDSQKTSGSREHLLIYFAVGFLMVYFLCPTILVYPLIRYYGHGSRMPAPVEHFIEISFYPIIKLADSSPAYRSFLDWQGKLIGLP